jgi:RNA polymerase sigma-70 factor, ECF subfamily
MLPPGLDDSELLRRARVDANAFAAFYRRHARPVYRSLLSDCGDPDVALDLTAETFARALQSIGRFRGPRVGSGRAWVFAIANSLFLQYERERRIEDRARRRLGILEATRLHCDDDSVVERADAAAVSGRLADVMHALPERQQSVLRLRIEAGASYEEIALRLGCSPAAARQQASRGMRRLTERFQAVAE